MTTKTEKPKSFATKTEKPIWKIAKTAKPKIPMPPSERETKQELIGSLGYIKCIPSLLVELSSCYLAFSGMGQDKIPPPHQVRRSFLASPGFSTWPSLKLEQSRNCQSMWMTACQTQGQKKWEGPDQTLDHYLISFRWPLLYSHFLPCSQTVPAFQNCWEKR